MTNNMRCINCLIIAISLNAIGDFMVQYRVKQLESKVEQLEEKVKELNKARSPQ